MARQSDRYRSWNDQLLRRVRGRVSALIAALGEELALPNATTDSQPVDEHTPAVRKTA